MRKLRFLLAALALTASLYAQVPRPTTVLSVADLLPTYGLDSALVKDTAAALRYLDSHPQDFAALTNLCVSLRTKAQRAIASLEDDYRHSDNLVWIDSTIVVGDYAVYEYRLRAFADLMGRRGIHYSRLEQQRAENEREAARQRALEEQQRQQDQRNSEAATLRQSIDLHHRSILAACDGIGITDRAKLKELKDLYYSYLMVYNKYDLSAANATDHTLHQLDELNAFQTDLLENILGHHSLPSQIENFKNKLKARCEKENTDVFRSYTRVFKQTSVPVTFADLKEYEYYIGRLQTIVAVQQRYLQTLDLRAVINQNSAAIQRLYSKKYRDIATAYKETQRTLNTLPAFTTNAESLNFIRSLEDFVEAQQIYMDIYAQVEEISNRSDTIIASTQLPLRDVAAAYRDLRPSLIPVPTFKTAAEAEHYLAQLEEVSAIQYLYQQTIDIRTEIARYDDSITARRRQDRVLWNGYHDLRRVTNLTPTFSTREQGERFIAIIEAHREMQQLVLETYGRVRIVSANADRITGKGNPYRNIARAYGLLVKDLNVVNTISNMEDLRRYNRQCVALIDMQQRVLDHISSELAADTDKKIRRESDTEKLRVALGLR